MHKSAKDLVASGDEKVVVDFAIETFRALNKAKEELEVCKTFLRKFASTAAPGAVSTYVEGRLGKALVIFPKPTLAVKRGVDLLAVEPNLPPEVFNTFFKKRVSVDLAEDFVERLQELPSRQRAIIQNLVEAVPSTPRVSLPK